MKERTMNTKFKIEKNIPLKHGRSRKYPFGDMEVGDSFLVNIKNDPKNDRHNLSSTASYFGIRNNKKFSVRKDGDGFRVWRVE